MYYLCSENKGADQLCSHFTADLHRQKSGFLTMQLLREQESCFETESYRFIRKTCPCNVAKLG